VKLGFFGREALRSMKRNAVPSFAALMSVLVTVLVLGVFIPIVQATNGAANEVRGRVLIDVFLKSNATRADIDRVQGKLDKDVPYVGRVEFVSKQQAYDREKKKNPEAYGLLGSNPLPDTFRVTPEDPDKLGQMRAALASSAASGGSTPFDEAVGKVQDDVANSDKIVRAGSVVQLSMGILAVLLIGASILLISNTIRLSLFSRRREVEVMKLVGATDWFIRWPFMIEGIVLGALGGVLAIALLLVGKVAFIDPLARDFSLIATPETINFPLLVGVLILAGIGVSAAGSALSLRRFLRV
jgi:cell division transport system permease protein